MRVRFCLLLLCLQACAQTADKPKKNVWKKSIGKDAASSKKSDSQNAIPESQFALPSPIQKAANLFFSHTEKPRKIAKYYFKKAAKEAAKLWKKFVNSGFSFEKLLATQIAAVLVYTIISTIAKSIFRRNKNKLVKKVYVATASHNEGAERSSNENENETEPNSESEESAREPEHERSAENNSENCRSDNDPQEIRRSRSSQINRRKSSSSGE